MFWARTDICSHQLKDIVIQIQLQMITTLQILLEGGPANYDDLLRISKDSRIRAVTALAQQFQRISVSAPLRGISSAKIPVLGNLNAPTAVPDAQTASLPNIQSIGYGGGYGGSFRLSNAEEYAQSARSSSRNVQNVQNTPILQSYQDLPPLGQKKSDGFLGSFLRKASSSGLQDQSRQEGCSSRQHKQPQREYPDTQQGYGPTRTSRSGGLFGDAIQYRDSYASVYKPPIYTQFETGPTGHALEPKVSDDALPPIPSWDTATEVSCDALPPMPSWDMVIKKRVLT